MHDIFVIYRRPADPDAFDAYYRDVHVPLVHAIPELVEFVWSKVDSTDPEAPYVIARLTYPDAETADRATASPQGQASRADVANFGQAGSVTWRADRQ
ncbi:EthD family reductase [Actinotalea fermentans]|uniref:Ethyl tert-butyl ether degradation protein EthD n=1 Tax=Actinotalea fermentans TaxID=43671 RepID=A0A511YXE9_9CELL|nr:EthD family reductase [Actinotalea fermentans]KGM17658.1 hypothetical protein N867_16855 [Actinotalea fermentans ATCC 43279 = JCM 9966 = DSM 3133]GEN79875.1 ethyl tert-butyl ether degradation protein EthD [Actinotalea fermentans]